MDIYIPVSRRLFGAGSGSAIKLPETVRMSAMVSIFTNL